MQNDELIARLKAVSSQIPRYLPSGLPANYAAIHRDQLARAPMRLRAHGDRHE